MTKPLPKLSRFSDTWCRVRVLLSIADRQREVSRTQQAGPRVQGVTLVAITINVQQRVEDALQGQRQ